MSTSSICRCLTAAISQRPPPRPAPHPTPPTPPLHPHKPPPVRCAPVCHRPPHPYATDPPRPIQIRTDELFRLFKSVQRLESTLSLHCRYIVGTRTLHYRYIILLQALKGRRNDTTQVVKHSLMGVLTVRTPTSRTQHFNVRPSFIQKARRTRRWELTSV